MTIWAAYQYKEEDRKGSLEPGKLADLVILSKDPTAVQPATIADIRVMEAVKEGRTIFTRTSAKTAASPPDITPFLATMAGHAAGQRAPAFPARAEPGAVLADSCVHDALFHLADAMAAPAGTR